eukprot:1160861-Pelagomonas_calceolata.AAC.6
MCCCLAQAGCLATYAAVHPHACTGLLLSRLMAGPYHLPFAALTTNVPPPSNEEHPFPANTAQQQHLATTQKAAVAAPAATAAASPATSSSSTAAHGALPIPPPSPPGPVVMLVQEALLSGSGAMLAQVLEWGHSHGGPAFRCWSGVTATGALPSGWAGVVGMEALLPIGLAVGAAEVASFAVGLLISTQGAEGMGLPARGTKACAAGLQWDSAFSRWGWGWDQGPSPVGLGTILSLGCSRRQHRHRGTQLLAHAHTGCICTHTRSCIYLHRLLHYATRRWCWEDTAHGSSCAILLHGAAATPEGRQLLQVLLDNPVEGPAVIAVLAKAAPVPSDVVAAAATAVAAAAAAAAGGVSAGGTAAGVQAPGGEQQQQQQQLRQRIGNPVKGGEDGDLGAQCSRKASSSSSSRINDGDKEAYAAWLITNNRLLVVRWGVFLVTAMVVHVANPDGASGQLPILCMLAPAVGATLAAWRKGSYKTVRGQYRERTSVLLHYVNAGHKTV